jgi:hypothetical protein
MFIIIYLFTAKVYYLFVPYVYYVSIHLFVICLLFLSIVLIIYSFVRLRLISQGCHLLPLQRQMVMSIS